MSIHYKLITMMSSYHLSPYKDKTLLLTVFPMLYISSLLLIYFVTRSLYYFPSPISLILLVPFPSGNHLFSVSVTLSVLFCLFMCFIFQTPHISEIIQYLSFSVWLILFSIIPSRSNNVQSSLSFFLPAFDLSIF